MTRPVPAAALAITKERESCKLKAYWDKYGEVWTIGWGHTGPDVHKGLVWTQAQADAALMAGITHAASVVDRYVIVPLNDNQRGALADFVYNLGEGHFAKSTLLKLLNRGNYNAVPEQLARWVYAGGTKLRGLEIRRAKEIALWSTPAPGAGMVPTPNLSPPQNGTAPTVPPNEIDAGTRPKPLTQSKTLWSQAMQFIAGGGATLLAYIQSPYAIAALAILVVAGLIIWFERRRHRREDGS